VHDAVQGGVHDIPDEAVVERGVAVQEPVVERAVEHVQRDLDLGVRRDLAALDRAAEDLAALLAARRDKACPVLGGEGRVHLRLGDEPGDHAPVRPAGGQPGPRTQQRQQVASQRSGVPRGRPGGRPLVEERVQRERFLGGPPAVDRGLADACPLGDRVHADRGQALHQQQFRRRLEDRQARLLAARPPAPRRHLARFALTA
jgi:hypothetical protein